MLRDAVMLLRPEANAVYFLAVSALADALERQGEPETALDVLEDVSRTRETFVPSV